MTVQLYLGVENSCWIASKFEWKPGSLLDLVVKPSSSGDQGYMMQFNIEMTLTTRTPDREDFDWSRTSVNQGVLKETAFVPKIYTITLEKGVFYTACDMRGPVNPQSHPRFSLRLSFDKSPYPPREEWKENGLSAADANMFWEWREFCSHEL
jgi:hypothetical protein